MTATELLVLAIRASIFLTVLGLGLSARRQDVTFLLRERGLLARSLLAMFVLMPAAAAVVASAFDVPFVVKVALVSLAIAPVPPILPRKELKAGARAGYAVGLLVVSAVIAIVYVPLALEFFNWVFATAGRVSLAAIAKIMLMSVLAPVAIGITIRHMRPALADKMASPMLLVGTLLLLVGTLPLLVATWPGVDALLGSGTVLIVAILAAIGLAAGHLLGGPEPENRTVLALSTSSRHPAVALAVATSGTAIDAKAAIPAILLYVIVAMLVAVPYVQWRRRAVARAASAHGR